MASNSVAAQRKRKRLWHTIKLWAGGASAFILAVSAVATALVTIAAAFPKIIPFWAPFDASILVRDIRVEKVVPIENSSNGTVPQPGAEIHLEYVEEKSGTSTLRECHPELKLQDVYQSQTWPRSQTITDPTQAKLSDTFVVPREQYAKEGSLRMVCERRITGWQTFQLPEVAGINKAVVTTYNVCLGEYREACGGTPNWIPCSGNVAAWAKSAHPAECVSVDYKKLSDVSGNRCGYATFQVTCSTK
jgi:hypothetical protein